MGIVSALQDGKILETAWSLSVSLLNTIERYS